MLLVEAQSLWPASAAGAVRFEAHDPSADRKHLRELAGWCRQFSPVVAVDAADSPDGLLIDLTGCGQGFGGEAELAEKAIVGLQGLGYRAVAAVADTVGAAWGVARYGMAGRCRAPEPGSRVVVVPPGTHADALRPLPIEALRLPASVVEALHELRVVRTEQLLALPRADLPSRFGPELLLCIDRALGALAEGLTPDPEVESPQAGWEFEPPMADRETLTAVIGHLLEKLLKRLQPDHLGVHRLLSSLKPAGHDAVHFPVELLRPTAALRDLTDLVRLRVERLQLPAEVTGVVVRVASAVPLEYRQGDLFGGDRPDRADEAARLVERMSSRLGERAVLRSRLYPDAQPELACRFDPWLTAAADLRARNQRARQPEANGRGPVLLTRPAELKGEPVAVAVLSVYPGGSPRRIGWDDRDYRVERAWGPERIETGWWRGADVRRDYYVVETTAGERLWVFRDLANGSWFLHGVFA
jgi:protein ImuB